MDALTPPARSWLFVPATRPERFARATSSGADRVIVDLEDAVAPEDKIEARRALAAAALPAGALVYLRVNGAATPWFEDDLATAATLPLAGVVVPKAERAEQLARAAAALPAAQQLVPIVESAAGLWDVLALARAPRVERLAFGALDLELDTGMRDEGDTLAAARSRVVLASRVAGVGAPIDSVTLTIERAAEIAEHAERSRRFGFAGKLCIHPRQVEPIHRAFRPGDADLAWARGLLAAVADRPPGAPAAFAWRGTMVDLPVIQRARRIVADAGGEADPPPP